MISLPYKGSLKPLLIGEVARRAGEVALAFAGRRPPRTQMPLRGDKLKLTTTFQEVTSV